jgi:hypothetical protein
MSIGWLTEFRASLKEWDALCQSAITAERFVRKQGLYKGCEVELTQCFDPSVQAPKALQFREQLLDFVKTEYYIFNRSERGTKTGSITELNLSGFSSAQCYGAEAVRDVHEQISSPWVLTSKSAAEERCLLDFPCYALLCL